MPQPQPSDVGFGYMSDNAASKHTSFAEVPMTPNSPLKSALRVPGTPGRLNPLSPTFKEEQVLEKSEESTEKQNAKDLVGSPTCDIKGAKLTMYPESQDTGPNGQDVPSFHQFQLQLDCFVHAVDHIQHIQCHQISAEQE